jgi:hypothetical protein
MIGSAMERAYATRALVAKAVPVPKSNPTAVSSQLPTATSRTGCAR